MFEKLKTYLYKASIALITILFTKYIRGKAHRHTYWDEGKGPCCRVIVVASWWSGHVAVVSHRVRHVVLRGNGHVSSCTVVAPVVVGSCHHIVVVHGWPLWLVVILVRRDQSWLSLVVPRGDVAVAAVSCLVMVRC